MEIKELHIRAIEKNDNAILANIIRNVLIEHKANKLGTAFYDESTDHLYEYFLESNHPYFVAEYNGEVVGGVGIYPTKGLPADTCELVKMYLIAPVRGKGIASELIEKSIKVAKEKGYKKIYLESMEELSTALKIYEKKGWRYLCSPIGDTGHNGCGLWMLKDL